MQEASNGLAGVSAKSIRRKAGYQLVPDASQESVSGKHLKNPGKSPKVRQHQVDSTCLYLNEIGRSFPASYSR